MSLNSQKTIRWNELKNVDVCTVKREELEDLNQIEIDESLPLSKRVQEFINKIKNPYCFRVGEMVVKVSYQDEGPSFQQTMEDMFTSM